MFFFFQAEDGIRDGRVTGVQTCALPISGDADLEIVVPGGRIARVTACDAHALLELGISRRHRVGMGREGGTLRVRRARRLAASHVGEARQETEGERPTHAQRPPPSVSSNSLRIRRYSSVQLSLRVKPCRSTGYSATSQFSFFSSISRCVNRAVSWKWTLSSTMP